MDLRLAGKIVDLEQASAAVAAHRAEGRRVVQAHGVFDLLHIGHMRFLMGARRLGEVLVVTLTPDRFVNKGPHRPAFSEALRAEALASLECVDYVVVNAWPTAVEAIGLLRPDFFAKGAEYRDNRTPEIIVEEEAIAAAGGRMVYVDELTSSSSMLLNRFLSPFPEPTVAYLADLRERVGVPSILDVVERLRGARLLVVGEAIIDEYHYCSILGPSSKAPVMAMQHLGEDRFAGGAAAIANHLAGFCDEVGLLTMVGAADDLGDWVLSQLQPNVNAACLRKQGAPTILKRRYRESYAQQHCFEVYFMDDSPLCAEDDDRLDGLLADWLGRYDAVLVADYGHSMLQAGARRRICAGSRFLAVNTQANAGNRGYHTVSKYGRADMVCLAETELRLEARDRTGRPEPMLERMAAHLGTRLAIATRGSGGCLIHEPGSGLSTAPALAVEVVDRVGAGDAFLALAASATAVGASAEIAAFLGNVAGSEAVATVGNRRSLERLPFSRHVQSLLK